MTNTKDINYTDFSNRRRYNQDNVEYARKNSVNSENIKKRPIKKKKKHKSNYEMVKRQLKLFGLGVSVTLVGMGLTKVDDIKKYFETQSIIHDTLSNYNEVINDYTYIIKDEDGYPLYQNGNVVHGYQTDKIGNFMKVMIDSGKNETAVIYGVYSTMVHSPDDLDDFYNSMHFAGLASKEDEWAKENGYSSMNDKEFLIDGKRAIIRDINIQKYKDEINSMFDDQMNAKLEDKSLGGK